MGVVVVQLDRNKHVRREDTEVEKSGYGDCTMWKRILIFV